MVNSNMSRILMGSSVERTKKRTGDNAAGEKKVCDV